VTKIAAKIFATSTIGPQWNWLCSRTARGVSAIDAQPSATSAASRARLSIATSTPAMRTPMPGCQRPDISTAATTAASSGKLIHPSMAIGVARGASPARGGSRRQSTESRAKYTASSVAATKSVGSANARVVQKKSMPFRKPMNSGGSPSGVSAPPTLPTSTMKNTTEWTTCRRPAFAVSSGRISSIEAPVVPMKLASDAPSASSAVLTAGVPASAPRTQMPPAMLNSANRIATKGMYSATIACSTVCSA